MVAVEFLEFRIPFFRQSLFSKKRQKDTYHLFLVNTWYIFHSTTQRNYYLLFWQFIQKSLFLPPFILGTKKNSEMVLFGGFSCYFAKIYYIQKKIFCPPSTIHCEHFVVLKAAISKGLYLNDIGHFLRVLTPHSPLSPILLNRLKGLMSPFGRSPLSPKQVMSFMLFLDKNQKWPFLE